MKSNTREQEMRTDISEKIISICAFQEKKKKGIAKERVGILILKIFNHALEISIIML